MPTSPKPQHPWVGQRHLRREDDALLEGAARFAADQHADTNDRHIAFLRSSIPHGRIRSLNVEQARTLPGVREILTGQDVAQKLRPIANILTPNAIFYPMATDHVRYVGEPVALIIAASRAIAEDAAALIDVDYDPLPPIPDLSAALAATETSLHPDVGSPFVHRRQFSYGDVADAFDNADHVVSFSALFPRNTSLPLETCFIRASFDPDQQKYGIFSNYSGPMALQTVMAASLGVSISQLNLTMPARIGGNFGNKQALYPTMILLALAAKSLGGPVQWREDRGESLIAATASSERQSNMEGAFDRNGKLLGLRIQQIENLGAYIRTPEPAGLYRMHGALNGAYDVQNIDVENLCVLTNQVPSGLNRGFGGPQYYHCLEGLMDKAARLMDLDPIEIRRRNFIRATAFPYKGPSGSQYDAGDYASALDKAIKAIGPKATTAASARKKYGRGIACSIETAGNSLGYMDLASGGQIDGGNRPPRAAKSGAGAIAHLTMDAFGGVVVTLDTPDCGQGYQTAAAQITADRLGLKPTDIQVQVSFDSAYSPWLLTSGNYANRFSTAVASAVARAADKAADKLRKIAADQFQCDAGEVQLRDGEAVGSDQKASVPLRRLAGQLHWDLANQTHGVEGPIHEIGIYAPAELLGPNDAGEMATSFTYSFQCDIVDVAIDCATGRMTIHHYVSTHDAGTILNPGLFAGQVEGGLAHGLGAALRETISYGDDGQPVVRSLKAYGPIVAADLPELTVSHVETPSPNTDTGAKGLGDGCAILAPSAVASAIADALGLDENPTPPFTPQNIWRLAQGLTL